MVKYNSILATTGTTAGASVVGLITAFAKQVVKNKHKYESKSKALEKKESQ